MSGINCLTVKQAVVMCGLRGGVSVSEWHQLSDCEVGSRVMCGLRGGESVSEWH